MKDYLLGAENTVMKKLKIAVDARTLGSRPSGVGMYLNDFLEQLITYDEFEWILFTDVKESEYIKRFEARGIKVIEWESLYIKVSECMHILHLLRRN